MKAYDLLDLAGRNLRESVLRNSLTTMGISVGIASLVALLSLGIGLQTLATKRLGRSGLFDTVFVTTGRGFNFGPPTQRRERDKRPRRPLDQAAREEIEKLPGVAEVYPDVRFLAQVRAASEADAAAAKQVSGSANAAAGAAAGANDQSRPVIIASLPESARSREAFDKMKGTFFTAPDAHEAVMQRDAAKNYFDDPDAMLGKQMVIRFAQRKSMAELNKERSVDAQTMMSAMMTGYAVVPREERLKIVGIIEGQPDGGFRGPGGGIYIPQKLAEEFSPLSPSQMQATNTTDEERYAALVVRLNKTEQVQATEDKIKAMGLNAVSLLDAAKSIRQFFAVLDMFLGIFGSLALAVASLGIINTLVMAILERRREIGIMKAIGASDADVQKLFFTEAAAMGALGGALGVLFGWAIGKVINFGTVLYMQRQQGITPDNVWFVPWWLVAGAIGFSIVVSLISGVYPARRAARLDPVQALRYE